jgi:Na+/proline symporter
MTRKISFALSVVAIGFSFVASLQHGLVKLGAIATALCSPLLGVFLLGLFFGRANARGTLIGFGMGLIVVIYIAGTSMICTENCSSVLAPGLFNTFWLGALGCMVTIVCGFMCSLALPPSPPEFLVGLTFWSRERANIHAWRCDDVDSAVEAEPLVN